MRSENEAQLHAIAEGSCEHSGFDIDANGIRSESTQEGDAKGHSLPGKDHSGGIPPASHVGLQFELPSDFVAFLKEKIVMAVSTSA